MRRDSVIVYRSFADAINNLSDEEAGKVYKAITKYAMDGIEPEFNDILLRGYFSLIKPQIDANNQRYENGLKGGRPPKNQPKKNQTKTKIKPMVIETENQTETKPKPNQNQTITKPKPKEKEKEKENEKEKVKEVGGPPPLPPAMILPCKDDDEYIVTQGEFEDLVDLYPNLNVMEQLRLMKGWLIGNKAKAKQKGDMPRFIYGWLNDETKKVNAAPQDEPKPKENRLGVFGDYVQSSTDDEWDDLTKMSLKEVNGL